MADISKIKVGDTTYDIESKNDHTHSNKTVLDKITNKSDNKTYGIKNGDLAEIEAGGVGQTYQVSGVNKGEIFNSYKGATFPNTASGDCSHAEGSGTTASGSCSHSEGSGTDTSGTGSHAEGSGTKADRTGSHAEGGFTTASGKFSHAEGYCTTSGSYALHTQGQYNTQNTGTESSFQATNDAFVIGNGTSDSSKSNAFRVDFSGNTYGLSAFNSTGADYAEYFEWLDGNTNNEDRIGYFVTLTDGCKIQKANATDEILGIVSGTAGVIGDSYEDTWNGMYLRDNFGRFIYEDIEVTYPERKVGDKVIEEARTVTEKHIKLNPNYDSTQEYTPRSQRKEWSCVGSMGKIYVRDDGTCQVNGKCVCNKNGIATASTNNTGWRVLERVNDSIIRVWFK